MARRHDENANQLFKWRREMAPEQMPAVDESVPESLPDDIAALKRIIADIASDAVSARTEIARLKFQQARYRRAEFGRSLGEAGAQNRAARAGGIGG